MSHAKGFTLIELMITIGIIGILAAIAYPSYINHVETTRRATAQTELMELTQFMERNFTAANSYATDPGGDAIALPFSASPKSGGTAYYNLSFNPAPTAVTYTIEAVPTGGQSGDPCGTLSVNHTGLRTHSGSAAKCAW